MFDAHLNDNSSRVDKLQLAALCGLMALGAVFVFSATMVSEPAMAAAWYRQSWVRQLIWYVLGSGAAAGLCFIDYRSISRWSFVVYWGTILLLLAVLVPGIGTTHGWGARRWIDLPFFQFQPSEFAKLAFILAGANFLSRPPDELRQRDIFWKSIGLMMLPFLLILKEPDLGSALVLLPTGLVMMLVAGNPECSGLFAAGGGTQRLHFLGDCRGGRVRWQRRRIDAVCGGSLHRIENRRPGARPLGQARGGGRCDAHFQPRFHQHRN